MAARYSEIEEYIMDKIHTGEWPVGYMIPKEVELCEQFGVSRSTVRTAMLRLVQEGHLKRVKRKGTFVTAPRVLEDTTVFDCAGIGRTRKPSDGDEGRISGNVDHFYYEE